MKRSNQSESGFILLILMLALIIAAAVLVMYFRVLHAQK